MSKKVIPSIYNTYDQWKKFYEDVFSLTLAIVNDRYTLVDKREEFDPHLHGLCSSNLDDLYCGAYPKLLLRKKNFHTLIPIINIMSKEEINIEQNEIL